ncbi:hypothetical protein Tco_0451536 [Tanacetum coccineum]
MDYGVWRKSWIEAQFEYTVSGKLSNAFSCEVLLRDFTIIITTRPSFTEAFLGTSELVEDDKEEDEEEEDKEVEESLDSNIESEDAEDEGPTVEDEEPAARDEGLVAGDEGPSMRVESLGLGGDEAVPEVQQQAALFVKIAVGEPLRLGYGSVPEPKRPERVSALRQPTLTT